MVSMDTELMEGLLWALIEDGLDDLIEDHYEDEGEAGQAARVKKVTRFDEAGLMTTNAGVVVKLSDGSEFQISVVRSGTSDSYITR